MPQGRESVISDQVDVIGRRCSRDGLKLAVEASFGFCGARFPSELRMERSWRVPQLAGI